MQMKILAIETSCDETAIAIVEAKGGLKSPSFRILSNVVASQVKVHAPFGGVVPNLAKREHLKNLPFVLKQALREAGKDLRFKMYDLRKNKKQKILKSTPEIEAIAVTIGPGLAPALWVGVNFAKELAMRWKKQLIAVNHMDGHIASVLLQQNGEISNFKFPAIALLVSGGHTELMLMKGWRNKKIIGETLDDAAGEAFDKVARMLELGYPGGPPIAAIATQMPVKGEARQERQNAKCKVQNSNLKLKIMLPRPMWYSRDYNFSFSGLKTAVLYLIEKLKKQGISVKKMQPYIAKEFQDAVVDVLVIKTINAAKKYGVKTVILGGGVAANNLLREKLGIEIKKQLYTTCYMLPDMVFTGDNAAMIAAAAYLSGTKTAWTKCKAIDTL